MRLTKTAVCTMVVVASLAALPGPSAAEAPPARTAVVGVDFFPPCFNALLDTCNVQLLHAVMDATLAGAYRLRPDYTFEPVLVDHVDVQADPFELTYHIQSGATWSDGVPITADDFLFTLDTLRDPTNATGSSRSRYVRVSHAERVDADTFRLSFTSPEPEWRRLFDVVLPKHVLSGRDFDTVWSNGIDNPATGEPLGSGPFLLTGRAPGASLTLTPNPRWLGEGPFLDEVVLRSMPTNDQFQGIRDGSVDLISPQPQNQIADVMGVPGVDVDWREGPVFEHVDINVTSTTMPLLREQWFRQALAYALDRTGAVAPAYAPILPTYPALQSLRYRMPQPEHEPTYGRYTFDPAAVGSLMTANGCSLGGDGIWVCGGIRASVKLATTTGNLVRETMQAHLIARARSAGIELVADNGSVLDVLINRLPMRQFETIMFAWVTEVGSSPRALYTCNAPQNHTGHCSAALDEFVGRAENTLDPMNRSALYNDAYDILAAEVPTIPLLARPVFQVRRDRLIGPDLNPEGTPLWNVERWRIAGDDVTPPTISCTATPSRIWFHKGKLVPVHVDVAVEDEGSGVEGFVLTAATSDEPGDGDIRDFVVGSPDTDGLIRAERDADGHGRVYTFRYAATDRAGNTATCETTVEIVVRKRGS
jgi:peptide/nickel transport system substrate-binding protein